VKSSQIRTAVEVDAAAWRELSSRMAAHDRPGVSAAVVAVQRTAATLATMCPLT
jgi:hypothetical protein